MTPELPRAPINDPRLTAWQTSSIDSAVRSSALTDSKIPDQQAAWEKGMTTLLAAMGGSNYVHHAAGMLESMLCVAYESYVIDDKFAARGTVDGKPVAFEGLIDLVFKNTRIYGGAWIFDPTSKPDDGLFEIVPFLGKRDWTSKAIVDLAESINAEDIRSGVLEVRAKVLRWFHHLIDCGQDRLATTFEVAVVFFDLSARKSVPIPPDIVDRARDLMVRTRRQRGTP